MTLVNPAHFVVRRDSYDQLQGYPKACAQVAQELLANPPAHFAQAFERITQRIVASPILNRDAITKNMGGFGQVRDRHRQFSTSLSGMKYGSDAGDVRKRYGRSKHILLSYRQKNHPAAIELSQLANEYLVTLDHPSIESADFMGEHRWSVICQKYDRAMDTQLAQAARETASKECYALLCHDCPYRRGSATLAQITLQFLAHTVGFDVPLVKNDIDLNTKACTRSVEDFLREWDNGDYFDKHITSEQVMGWHRRRIVQPANAFSH